MKNQIQYLLELSEIDQALDEYAEDFGDLPVQLKKLKTSVDKLKTLIDETSRILNDVRKFSSNAHTTLMDMAEREKTLSEKQFKVRNNKEFDAITKEIEHIRMERSRIANELSTIGVKEQNLVSTLAKQKSDYEESSKDLIEKEKEFKLITSGQNSEVKDLNKKRKEIVKFLDDSVLEEYERIKNHLIDAVVRVKKHSCSGCFSSVPSQKIVEIRNNPEKIYTCENCGRILFPEDVD
jgi:uncharacterized protein